MEMFINSLVFFRVPWRGLKKHILMRTGADHTILKQPTKVSALGIMGSYRQINYALSRKRN